MEWPPRVGESLPRGGEAWYEQIKLDDWVLARRGHGAEWERVFGVGAEDRDSVWEAITTAALDATVVEVRDRSPFGIVCGIEVELTVGERTAPATVSWHYASKGAAPRLVTAYPTP
jgi:hypothetical protein